MAPWSRATKALGGLGDFFEAGPNFVWDVTRAIKDDGLSAGMLATSWAAATNRVGQAVGGLIGPEGFGGQIAGGLPEEVRSPLRRTIGTGYSPDERGLGGEEFFGHGVLGFLEASGRELIREPLTTISHVDNLASRGGSGGLVGVFKGDVDLGAYFDRRNWKQGHDIAQGRSIGQSLALGMMTKDILDPDEITKAQGTGYYKFLSGSFDAAARIFLDADTMVFGVGLDAARGATKRGALNNAEGGVRRIEEELHILETAKKGRKGITEELLEGSERGLGPVVGRVLKVQSKTPAMAADQGAAFFGETAEVGTWARVSQTLFKTNQPALSSLDEAIQSWVPTKVREADGVLQHDTGALFKWAHRQKLNLTPSELASATTPEEVYELIARKVAVKRKYAAVDLLDDAGEVTDTIVFDAAKPKTVLTPQGLERAAKKMSYQELSRRDSAWATFRSIREGGIDKAIDDVRMGGDRFLQAATVLAHARDEFFRSKQFLGFANRVLDDSGVWMPGTRPREAALADELAPVADEAVPSTSLVPAEATPAPSGPQEWLEAFEAEVAALGLENPKSWMQSAGVRDMHEAGIQPSLSNADTAEEFVFANEDRLRDLLGDDVVSDIFFRADEAGENPAVKLIEHLREKAPIEARATEVTRPMDSAEDFQRAAYRDPLAEKPRPTGDPPYREVALTDLPELYRQRHILLRMFSAGEFNMDELTRYMKALDDQELGLEAIAGDVPAAMTRPTFAEPTLAPLAERELIPPAELDLLAADVGLVRQGKLTLGQRIERIRDRYFHNVADGEKMATWLANSHTPAEVEAVMRFSMGEYSALDKIGQTNPALYQDMMRVMLRRSVQRELPWLDSFRFHEEEFKLYNDPATWKQTGVMDDIAQGSGREMSEVIEQLALQAQDPEFIAKELAILRQVAEDTHYFRTGTGVGGAAREALVTSRVYQSRANITRVFVDMAAPHIIEVNDPNVTGKIKRHLRDARLSPEEQAEYLSRWAAIRDNEHLRQDLLRDISKRGIETLALKYGIDDPDELALIIEQVSKAQSEGSLLLRNAARYAGTGPGGKELSRVTLEDAVTGEISHIYSPLTTQQLSKAEVMPNFRQIEKSMKAWGRMKREHPLIGSMLEAPPQLLNEINKMWKVSVLLRPAWPMRVVFDEQVRMIGALGFIEAIAGKVANVRDLRMQYMRDFFPLKDPDKNVLWMDVGEDGRMALTREPASSTSNKAVDLRKAKVGSSAVGAIVGGLLGGTPGALLGAGGGYLAGRRGGQLANGLEYLHQSHTRKVALDGYAMAFAYGAPGDVANLFHDQNSAQRQMDNLRGITPSEIYHEMRLDPRRWRYYTPGEEGYEIFWNRAVNYQFHNSEFTRMLWNDALDDEAIVQWLTEGKGQSVLNSMPKERQLNVDEWVANARDMTRNLIPETQAGIEMRAAKARGEKVTMAELQEQLGPDWGGQLGTVHGMEFIELTTNQSPTVRLAKRKLDNIMRHLGTTPTDTLSRHPYFDKVYQAKVRQQTALLKAGDDGMYRVSKTDLTAIQRQARRSALSDVRGLLYDLAEQSHFAQAVNFVSPFFMAWQEVITRYAGITMENPLFMSRAYKVYNSAGKADLSFMGIDTYTDETTGNEFIRIQIPDSARALLNKGVFKGAWDSQGTMLFDKKGINMLAQGSPGFGPIVAAPLSWAVKDRPELEESMRFIFPYGLPDPSVMGTAEAFLPTGARRALSLGMDDRSMAAVKARILQTKITQAAERGEPYDFNDKLVLEQVMAEVDAEASALAKLRIATAMFSPVPVSFQSPYQEFIERFYELRDEDYLTAVEKFREEKGEEFFALTQSFSKVNDGVAATYESEAAREKYRELVEAYPDLGALIVGEEGAGNGAAFIRSIYERQFREEVSVGDPRTRREMLPLNVVATDPDRRLGWLKFSRFNDWLTDQMDRAGVTNLSVKKAQPLLEIKQAFVEDLAEKHPAWYLDYSDIDDNKWVSRMEGLRAIVENGPPELTNRPDIRGLRSYLGARTRIEQILAARKAAGGSGNLGANANADVRATWETITLSLSERNLAFSDLYSRWLENDPVSEPSWAA
jgi:hypothetical protein